MRTSIASTNWKGPALGLPVTFISPTHTPCLFLEFGKLNDPDILANGEKAYPIGECTLSTFASFPAWILRCGTQILATSTDNQERRDSALRRLLGRQLQDMAIDGASKATVLVFSLGITLETETNNPGDRGKDHWMLRSSEPESAWSVIGALVQPQSVSEWQRLVLPHGHICN